MPNKLSFKQFCLRFNVQCHHSVNVMCLNGVLLCHFTSEMEVLMTILCPEAGVGIRRL